MLSSKLKSWVESHLTRKNKTTAEQRHNNNNNNNHSSSSKTGSTGAGPSHGVTVGKEVDRIAHPAASLVNLVPAVPLCSSNGRRSNAGVVIRLQNDFAAAASAASASGSTRRHHHPSWTQSPVMLAWNTKLSRVQQQQQQQPKSLFEPPSTPPPSASSTIQQKSSPTGSDWTQSTQSFAADSGCGEEGTLSSTADFTTVMASSERINATPTLSSPESAYSTGCSDGVSPISRDDNIFEPLMMVQHKEPVAPWRRSLMDNEGSSSSTATQSPARTRPAIRTNPWLPVRTSLTSTSDRASWMTDATAGDTGLSELLPASVKETDIVSSGDDDDDVDIQVESLSSALALADRQMDMLCNSLDQLMDEQELRRSFRRKCPPSPAPPPKTRPEEETNGCWNADDQYSQLIRQTEEILLQLENDELLLGANRKQQQPEEQELVRKAPTSAVRRRLRKTRRRCSSRSSARDVGAYSSTSDSASDSSDCCDYSPAPIALTRMAYRQPARRASSSVASGAKVNARFANRNGRVTTTHQAPPPPPPRMDRWLANSQRTSCTPDVGEHDRPPSPAPMDPHCHWPSPGGRRPAPSGRDHRRSYRQHSSAGPAPGSAGSCPASPAVGYSRQYHQQWRHQQQQQQQSVNREQQRLESQIAFLRQQLKDVTDDYYYDRLGNTPSSSE